MRKLLLAVIVVWLGLWSTSLQSCNSSGNDTHDITDDWVLRKSIQKAIESYRVTDDHKKILRDLRNR